MEKTQRIEKEEEKIKEKKPKLEQSVEEEKEKGEEKEEEMSTLPFSYNIVMPLTLDGQWVVLEKGSEQSQNEELRFQFSYNTIRYEIHLISELAQNTRSIKDRGVVYALNQLSREQKAKGVVAVSYGSYAYSLAHYGFQFGIPVTLVVPLRSDERTISLCRILKAEVLTRGDIKQTHKVALNLAQKEGKVYLDGNDHPNMIIGQSTLALEIVENNTKFDAVVLPTMMKDSGLTVGIAMALKELKPDMQVMIVQNELSDPSIKHIREQTNSLDELDIRTLTYDWNQMSAANSQGWRDRSDVTIHPSHVYFRIASEYLKLKHGEDDSNAALALTALLLDKFKELRGKKIAVPIYGKMDYSIDREVDMASLNETTITEVPGPSKRS
ncbi:PREDICTED: uncharacterized protein LOC105562274 [Vollenhovia emeryi]|uniref:uncharacterized protein LOC105562274 n=1 Tax=Vollenhovia emeryi TaxID=411798 RepID=UPI0005F4411D|nr:PREDICTED: uncharacterized protein LOC105562274 [Vollenhovia emeryi]